MTPGMDIILFIDPVTQSCPHKCSLNVFSLLELSETIPSLQEGGERGDAVSDGQ